MFRCILKKKQTQKTTNPLREMDYTLSSVTKRVLPSVVYVLQTWLQGVKVLISKTPLCFCSPDMTFGRVLASWCHSRRGLRSTPNTQSIFHPFPNVLSINTVVKGSQLEEKWGFLKFNHWVCLQHRGFSMKPVSTLGQALKTSQSLMVVGNRSSGWSWLLTKKGWWTKAFTQTWVSEVAKLLFSLWWARCALECCGGLCRNVVAHEECWKWGKASEALVIGTDDGGTNLDPAQCPALVRASGHPCRGVHRSCSALVVPTKQRFGFLGIVLGSKKAGFSSH